jgi:hypothetical protein
MRNDRKFWTSPVIASVLALAHGCTPSTEWINYVEPPLLLEPGCRGDGESKLFRVVDVYGQPIVGALAYDVASMYGRPVSLESESWHRGSAVSDQHGFVILPIERMGNLINVRVVGFSDSTERFRDAPDVFVLHRAVPVPIRVVDWIGRPAAGEIGYAVSSGAFPDFETASIGTDGLAWFHRVGYHCQLYPRCPGLGAEYAFIGRLDSAFDPAPQLYRLFSAPPIVGRVVGPDEQPLANIAVGMAWYDRGLWVSSATDGSFRLEFLPYDSAIRAICSWVSSGGLPQSEAYDFPGPPRRQALTLRIGEPGHRKEAPSLGRLRLRALWPDGSPVPDDVALPGLYPPLEPDGEAGWRSAEVVPGDYGIQIGAPGSEVESDEVAVTVSAGRTSLITLEVRKRPLVRISVVGPKDARVDFATAQGIICGINPGAAIPVPCDGDAAFWIGGRAFPLPRDFATRTQPIELVPPAPAIVGRLLGEQGEPCRGIVTFDRITVSTGDDGTFKIPFKPDGVKGQLECRAATSENNGSVRTMDLYHGPVADDYILDIGDIRCWRSGPFVLHTRHDVTIDVEGMLLREGRAIGEFRQDGEEGYEGPEPRAGDYVLLSRYQPDFRADEIKRELLFPLVGCGPWTLSEPGAKILFDVVDENGESVDAWLWYGALGEKIGSRQLTSLASGPHSLLLTAPGHRTAHLRVVLGDGEHRRIRVELARVPGH